MSASKKTDAEWLLGDRGEIYRMPRSGAVYQCRIWVPDERKYLRKSLKTTDYETAKQRGEKLILQTLSDVHSGKKSNLLWFSWECKRHACIHRKIENPLLLPNPPVGKVYFPKRNGVEEET